MLLEEEIFRSYQRLEKFLQKNKVLVIYGARRVGKTTLIKQFLAKAKFKYKFDSGDDIRIQEVLGSSDFSLIKQYCSGYDLICIDEAQNIANIGKGLKIMVDHVEGLRVIVTGSSSFDLANQVGEPLVGRHRTLKLFPIWLGELKKKLNKFELNEKLEEYLVFGLYPEVVTTSDRAMKAEYLVNLVNSYLLKDVLTLEQVKSPRVLMDLLRMLAYQLGNEVSLNELSRHLSIDVKTVARYLDLLEKSFVIISVGGFSRNLRTEVTSKKKYYFLDTGIRNAIINAFNPLDNRNDIGALWENFVMIERLKKKTYTPIYANDYFWRTYSKKEIDLIEERDGKLFAYEFKWKKDRFKIPEEWKTAYSGNPLEVISRENYLDFVL